MASAAPAVALSTASVYPEPTRAAFEIAAELGYDGVELMVWNDPVSQDLDAVRRLARRYRVPVRALHAPCLAVTQRVWGADPVARLHRSAQAAERLGADTVVVHPPFRWQRRYAAAFGAEVAKAEAGGVRLAVENMFALRRAGLRTAVYATGPEAGDPTPGDFAHYTLDLSHTAVAGLDALELADRMGERLAHLHLADGTGAGRDEHLVPGTGTQPCAEVCDRLAGAGFAGTVVVEVSTRRCRTRGERAEALARALLFARLHLQPSAPRPVPAPPPVPAGR